MPVNRFSAELYHHDSSAAVGVLLCNLGSPDAPTPSAVRRYLAEFLWDPRLIEMPRPLWWLILHGVVLRLRPKRSAAAYKKVWSDEGAPLIAISRRQASALQRVLEQRFSGPVNVVLAMRYGQPSIAAGLRQLRQAGVQRLLVLPLYPQYSATTTASIFDAVSDELKRWRWLPELRMVTQYHDHDGYITALANSVRDAWQKDGQPERLLISFHGMPLRYFRNGDPYFCHCQKTARLLVGKLALDETQWQLSFQSRFGREAWLQPYTDETLTAWAAEGVKKIAVICPGFAADCLETLEEIVISYRELYLAAGGESLSYIPALNEGSEHINALADIVYTGAQGWPEVVQEPSLCRDEAEQRQQRALAMRGTHSQTAQM